MSPKAPTFDENPFQALCPGHRGVTFCDCAAICFTVFPALVALATFCRCYQGTVLAIRTVRRPGEHAVESSQVNPGLRHLGSKPSHEIQRLEDDMGSAIPKAFAALMGQAFSIRFLQLIADVAV